MNVLIPPICSYFWESFISFWVSLYYIFPIVYCNILILEYHCFWYLTSVVCILSFDVLAWLISPSPQAILSLNHFFPKQLWCKIESYINNVLAFHFYTLPVCFSWHLHTCVYCECTVIWHFEGYAQTLVILPCIYVFKKRWVFVGVLSVGMGLANSIDWESYRVSS